MHPSIVAVPINSSLYLGLTFDKYYPNTELRKMQNDFKKMANKYRRFPNLTSVCHFMHVNLLNHTRFQAYLVSPTALGAATMILFKDKPPKPFVEIQRAVTCLLSETEFIRFTIRGYEVAGLWVRNVHSKQGLVRQPYTFNVDLSAHYGGEFLLYGNSLAADVQQLITQVMTLL